MQYSHSTIVVQAMKWGDLLRPQGVVHRFFLDKNGAELTRQNSVVLRVIWNAPATYLAQ